MERRDFSLFSIRCFLTNTYLLTGLWSRIRLFKLVTYLNRDFLPRINFIIECKQMVLVLILSNFITIMLIHGTAMVHWKFLSQPL